MKKLVVIALALVMVLTLGMTPVLAGNGLPDEATGKHFNLNIIGVKNAKSIDTDETKANGHVIFVSLDGHSKIRLVDSAEVAGLDADDYAVLDKNATDNDGALLALPKPGLEAYNVADPGEADTISDYSVFVRPLGKPGGWATITTCAELLDSDFAGLLSGQFSKVLNKLGYFGGYASVEQVGQDITLRTNGKNGKTQFTNVTAELLTIVFTVEIDTDGDGIADTIDYIRVPIFDDIIQGEYWDYDNHNLKLLQVRFYPCGTDVSLDDGTWNNE